MQCSTQYQFLKLHLALPLAENALLQGNEADYDHGDVADVLP